MNIQFKKGCRDCNQGDGMECFISDYENDLEYYQNLSDYKISEIINKTLLDNDVKCQFYNSIIWDISNIKVDNLQTLKEIYGNFEKHILIYSLSKKNNQGNLTVDKGYNLNEPNDTYNFGIKCKNEIQQIINSKPANEFTHHADGLLYFCFTGKNSSIKLEKFRYTGFSKEALINITNKILDS